MAELSNMSQNKTACLCQSMLLDHQDKTFLLYAASFQPELGQLRCGASNHGVMSLVMTALHTAAVLAYLVKNAFVVNSENPGP